MLIEAILRRRDVPRAVLLAASPAALPPDLQEVLLLRQDAIVEEPAILEALEENPQLSTYTRRRIAEYREHLLPRAAHGTSCPLAARDGGDGRRGAGAAIEAARARPPVGELEPRADQAHRGADPPAADARRA